MFVKYFNSEGQVTDMSFRYIFSYADIIDPTNKITKCLDEAWKYATTLKWADPPGDLRFTGDSIPSMTVNNIVGCPNVNAFDETVDLLQIHIALIPYAREYNLDAKILIDPDEFQYLIDELVIDPTIHNICVYDDTREDLKSMVVIKHFLEQLVLHLKPKFGLMHTSRVLAGYSYWLSRDQRMSLMSSKQEGGNENGKEED
jgi:hypothetical protein